MSDPGQDDALEARLRHAEEKKAGSYDKRTGHLDARGKTLFVNRLILEDSPYLLQHAHNPVNWYAWGAEAFATAEREGKPVFLSIGYSTCHWCHVMEEESFDNLEVARVLNRDFISVKMDREQYPDIDEVYMTGVQLISGQGGWPMSSFLLPDGKPFFAGTYFPAAAFLNLLAQIATVWTTRHEELADSARRIGSAIDRILGQRKEVVALAPDLARTVVTTLLKREDGQRGGLAGAPKFPQEPLLLFMLDRVRRERDPGAWGFVARALDGMGRGGIYDQVGGGFHRYSVDADWLVPHFEKMLYNQSQCGLACLEAYLLSGDPFFRRLCAQTLDYVLRELRMPEGGFHSATDADSEGREGVFFLWTPRQLRNVLSADEADSIIALYEVSEGGNFEGANVLHLPRRLDEQLQRSGIGQPAELDRMLGKLYRARQRRQPPLRDDKMIVAWTGAMITTLARAAFHLDRADWLQAAEQAAHCVLRHNGAGDDGLRRIWLDATASVDGRLEDYANFIEALVTLFDVTTLRAWLEQAVRLGERMLEEFHDKEGGAFFTSPRDQAGPRFTRSRSAADGATVSSVATALRCLVLLHGRSALLAGADAGLDYGNTIERCIVALGADLEEQPLGHTSLLRVIDEYRQGATAAIQYAGLGLARIAARRSSGDGNVADVELTISLAEGWHVAAPSSDTGDFAPLHLGIGADQPHWQLHKLDLPSPTARLDVHSDAVAEGAGEGLETAPDLAIPILAGEFTILARCQSDAAPGPVDAQAQSQALTLELRLQLCNHSTCRRPETLLLVV